MSIQSSIEANHTNKWLKEKAITLQKAFDNKNWEPVLDFIKWAESEPMSE